ncbi:MAG TPA: hypothetical protein VGC04_05025 [Cellulomonas sp.]
MKPRGRWAAVVITACVMLLGDGALATMTGPTSAAWTDPALLLSTASSGIWSAGPGACSVERLPGYTGAWNNPACSVTALRVDTPWDAPGDRQTYVYVTVTFTGSVQGGQEPYFRIDMTANLATAANLPADWNWATTGVAQGNLLGKADDYQCSSLTQPGAPFEAYVHGNYFRSGHSVVVGFPMYENHGSRTSLICP